MILIKKGTPPSELEELKQKAEFLGLSDKEGYDLLRNPLKKEVRNSLVQEQGHLCAYCMRRIPDERIPCPYRERRVSCTALIQDTRLPSAA